jgi:VIT1/CCC1 family predicted Fe2+/Mn2+ transporter
LIEFIRRHLDPASRLGEVLFGLIMALGFTAAIRISGEATTSREMFIAISGCNLAWAIVDGVMYVLGNLFERARRVRVVREVAAAANEEAALEAISREIDGPLIELTREAERRELARWVLAVVRDAVPQPARIRIDDLLGGAAVFLLIVLATLPMVAPFVLIDEVGVAVRVSNGIGVGALGLLGAWWARMVGGSPVRVGLGLSTVSLLLVLITIALGG